MVHCPGLVTFGILEQRGAASFTGKGSGPVAWLCPGAPGSVHRAQGRAVVKSSTDSETCFSRALGHKG